MTCDLCINMICFVVLKEFVAFAYKVSLTYDRVMTTVNGELAMMYLNFVNTSS